MTEEQFTGLLLVNGFVLNDSEVVASQYKGSIMLYADRERGSQPKKAVFIDIIPIGFILNKLDEKSNIYRQSSSGLGIGRIKIGPVGHPGDGEFEEYPVTDLDLSILIKDNKINLAIEGKAEEGFMLHRGHERGPEELSSCSFSVKLSCSLGKFKRWLKKGD